MKITPQRPVGLTLLAALLFTGLATADEPRKPPKLDADFAYVTPDMNLFITVRLADVLVSEQVQMLMTLLEKIAEGTEQNPLQKLKAFEQKLGLKLADVERVTFVATDLQHKEFWIVVRTKKDIDKDKVLALLEKTEEKTVKGKTYHWQKQGDVGIHFVGPRLALIATERGMERCIGLTGKEQPRGPLAGALALASGDRYHLFLAADVWHALPVELHEQLTQQAKGDGSEAELADAVLKMRTATYAIRFGKKLEILTTVEFRNADAARRMAAILEKWLDEARKQVKLFPPGAAPLLEMLDQAKPVVVGNVLTSKAEIDTAILMGLLLPAVQKTREAAARSVTQDNLHNVALAMHNYISANTDSFPPAAIRDKTGKPLLSWRVQMLPELEQNALYKQFKLDEPWDSPNNIKLLEKMPKVYEAPYLPAAKPGHTHFQVCAGRDTLFPLQGRPPTMFLLTATKGASNTILVAIAAKPVPWTKPEDIVIDKEAIKTKLYLRAGGTPILLCDGSVPTIMPTVKEKSLRTAILFSDNDVLPADWLGGSPSEDKPGKDKRKDK